MKNNIYIVLFLICGMLTIGCIDELIIDTEQEERILVVEGYINTDLGPHDILLSKSAKYGSIFEGVVRKEVDAFVRIRDDQGDQIILIEAAPGRYQTPNTFKAESGLSYTLLIELANGENYISAPEKALPVAPIESLVPVYKLTPGIDEFTFSNGLEIYAEWTDPEDENYYWWESNGYYPINTRPDLFSFIDGGGNRVFAPKACCDRCFVADIEGDEQIRIFRDNLSNGGTVRQQVAFIGDDGGRFQEKYMMALSHSSISKEAFQFYSLLDNQLSIDGDIFDPPPATIRGNILNLDHPEDNVIGFFRVSSTFHDTIFLDRSLLLDFQPMRAINDDCQELPLSTLDEPSFWK